jgi:hypothetical protein
LYLNKIFFIDVYTIAIMKVLYSLFVLNLNE